MGNRLSKIYTKTGDAGETGIATGQRIAKDHLRIEVIGDIDELNAAIGLARATGSMDKLEETLEKAQHKLFDLGGELAMVDHDFIVSEDVDSIESCLDELNAGLPPLKEFVLPGGSLNSAALHMARAICRRAERRLVSLARSERVNPIAQSYLNRLSDLLFVMSRYSNTNVNQGETMWKHDRRKTSE